MDKAFLYLSKLKPATVNNIGFFLLAIVVGVIAFLGYKYYFRNTPNTSSKNQYIPNQITEPSSTAEFTLFYANWCPHCKGVIPIYDSLITQYNNKEINGHVLKLRKIDCSDNKNSDVVSTMNTYDVQGFPSIVLSKNGQLIHFDSTPDKESIEKFIKEMII